MKYFLYKLIPPRPTFAFDMTDEEKQIMQTHSEYWSRLCDERTAVLFGPVLEPNSVWGLGILEVEDESAAHAIAMSDPAVTSGVNTFELHPVLIGKIR